MDDRIEQSVELKAPVSRVWRALTDYREFGEWFRVKLDGPFLEGQASTGFITHPGYEHIKWKVIVQKMDPERLFSFTWHPYAIDPNIDYSMMAKAYGMYGAGPISNPNDLGPAIKKAIEVVKKGEPALLDVITQPR